MSVLYNPTVESFDPSSLECFLIFFSSPGTLQTAHIILGLLIPPSFERLMYRSFGLICQSIGMHEPETEGNVLESGIKRRTKGGVEKGGRSKQNGKGKGHLVDKRVRKKVRKSKQDGRKQRRTYGKGGIDV